MPYTGMVLLDHQATNQWLRRIFLTHCKGRSPLKKQAASFFLFMLLSFYAAAQLSLSTIDLLCKYSVYLMNYSENEELTPTKR